LEKTWINLIFFDELDTEVSSHNFSETSNFPLIFLSESKIEMILGVIETPSIGG
jgi:hypothetical protein